MKDEGRKWLMELNYEAAELAKTRHGSDLTGLFLEKAKQLIKGDSDWDTSYELVLHIYNSIVSLETSRGRYEDGITVVDIILQHAKKAEDTIVALAARTTIREAALQFDMAVEDAKKTLQLCGERLPAVNSWTVTRELRRTKRLVEGKSEKELSALFQNDKDIDKRKMIAMKTYFAATVCGWHGNTSLLAICILRFFRLAVQFRQNQYTGIAFAAFGALLATYGDVELGSRFAQLGLKAQIEDDIPPDAIVYAYSCVMHLNLPLASLLEMSLTGYRRGLSTGDPFPGITSLLLYVDAYKGSGLRLDALASDLSKYAEHVKIIRGDFMLCMMLPTLQLALNLIGQSDDPVKIDWEIIKKHGYCNEGVEIAVTNASLQLHCTQMFNSLVMRDVETAEAAFRNIQVFPRHDRMFQLNYFNKYFCMLVEGLVGFWLGKEKRNKSYRKCAIQTIKWFKKRPNLNSVPLCLLLEAQEAATQQQVNTTKVKSLFDYVIVMLARSGLVHYGAIANELAAEFLLEYEKNRDVPKQYLMRSMELYMELGATAKVSALTKRHNLSLDHNTTASIKPSTLRGRERFSSRVDATGTSMTQNLVDDVSTEV